MPQITSENVLNYADNTFEQISQLLKKNRLLLPIGSIEQHGPHLPLSVDIDIPTAIVNELSRRGYGMVAPGITYGARSQPNSGGGASYPGTIYIRGDILILYFVEIIKSYIHAGANEIIIINGHYENEAFIFEALDICREKKYMENIFIISLSWWSSINDAIINEICGPEFVGWHAEHAGIVETSLMMHLKPHLVRDIRVNHLTPPLAGTYLHPIDANAISSRGVLTKTQGATHKIGEVLFKHICQNLENLIQTPHGLAR